MICNQSQKPDERDSTNAIEQQGNVQELVIPTMVLGSTKARALLVSNWHAVSYLAVDIWSLRLAKIEVQRYYNKMAFSI